MIHTEQGQLHPDFNLRLKDGRVDECPSESFYDGRYDQPGLEHLKMIEEDRLEIINEVRNVGYFCRIDYEWYNKKYQECLNKLIQSIQKLKLNGNIELYFLNSLGLQRDLFGRPGCRRYPTRELQSAESQRCQFLEELQRLITKGPLNPILEINRSYEKILSLLYSPVSIDID